MAAKPRGDVKQVGYGEEVLESEVEQGGTAAEREVWALKGEVQELRREVARYKSIEAARKASYWADSPMEAAV